MARKSRRTLRRMTPLSREVAKLANEAASLNVRLMNLTEKIAKQERKANALDNFMVTIDMTGTIDQIEEGLKGLENERR